MRSQICFGEVSHSRLHPVAHAFTYPLYFYRLDLEELPKIRTACRFFSFNSWNLCSIWEKDYLKHLAGTLRERITRVLRDEGGTEPPHRIELLTSARYFGYAFNPVNFYLCYSGQDALRSLVAEVNNTFGDTHLYVLPEPHDSSADKTEFRSRKDFHVSPFWDLDGEYRFTVTTSASNVSVAVDLIKENHTVFRSRLSGRGRALSSATVGEAMLRFPLNTALNLPRIFRQAATLYFRHRLPVHSRPVPQSRHTVGIRGPSYSERFAMVFVRRALESLTRGTLVVSLPNGEQWTFEKSGGRKATLEVRDYGFFAAVAKRGDIGLGESYVRREWDSENLVDLLLLFTENPEIYDHPIVAANRAAAPLFRFTNWLRSNTVLQSEKNIHAHYDVGNDFYARFLDRSMLYSSALFDGDDDSLEAAQQRKLDRLLDRAKLKPEHHVLEIGTGWGALALEAVKQAGCRVTTTTISKEQHAFAAERFAGSDFGKKISLLYKDYRQLEGKFDRIISVEMIEAVGERFLPTFFRKCDELLKPGGLLVLQCISIADQRYDAYRRGSDYIRQHIFPGGHLPSLTKLANVATAYSSFVIEHVEDIGLDYARTLAEWRSRLEAARDGLDEATLRKWRFYFAYCESGFRARITGNLHLVLRKAS